jgi:hypothetical protein
MATEINQLELYTQWYLNELKEAGYIKLIKREAFPILVSDEVKRKRYDFSRKTETRIEDYSLFRQNTYLYDYLIIWEKRAHELFYNLVDDSILRIYCPFYAVVDAEGEHVSFLDVKPPAGAMIFGNNTTGYTFPILQKIIYTVYGIYVNKTIPIPLVSKGTVKSGNKVSLFTTTFVPKRYLMTDGGGQARVINYKINSLKEYVSSRTKEIDRINAVLSVQQKLL